MILQIGEVLSGKLLVYNILNSEQQKFSYDKNVKNSIDLQAFESKYNNESSSPEIEFAQILKRIDQDDFLFVDVRNLEEQPKLNFKNAIQIPLNQLETELDKIDANKEVFVYCQSGVRSLKAIAILQKHQFNNVKSIIGGAVKINEVLESKSQLIS